MGVVSFSVLVLFFFMLPNLVMPLVLLLSFLASNVLRY